MVTCVRLNATTIPWQIDQTQQIFQPRSLLKSRFLRPWCQPVLGSAEYEKPPPMQIFGEGHMQQHKNQTLPLTVDMHQGTDRRVYARSLCLNIGLPLAALVAYLALRCGFRCP